MAKRSGGDKLFQKNKEKEKEEFKRVTNNRHTVHDVIVDCEDSVSTSTLLKNGNRTTYKSEKNYTKLYSNYAI